MDLAAANNNQQQDNQDSGTIVLAKCGPCGRVWPVLLPDSKLHTSWEIFGLFLIIYELITLPYKLVFEVDGGPILQKVDLVSMSYFCIDIVKNFNLAYYHMGNLVASPVQIIKTYLKGWFLIDLVASVPFQYVFPQNSAASSTRMLRIIRLARFLKILRLLKVAKVKKLLRRLEETTDTFFLASFALKMSKVILWLVLLSHFSACAWYLVGKTSEPDTPLADGTKNWIDKISPPIEDDDEDRVFMLYLNALYFSLATMTTVGYGDLSPVNSDEKLFGIFYFLLSIVAFSGVVGSVGEVLHAFQNASAGKRSQLSELKQYMRWRKIPIHVQQKLRHFQTYSLEHCDADLVEQEEMILKQLSPALRQQVCYLVFGDAFKTLSCLDWLFNDRRTLPRDMMLTRMKTELHGPGDILFIAGEVADKVYSVVEGSVVIIKQRSDVTATHSNEYMKLLEYQRRCLMADLDVGRLNPNKGAYVLVGRTEYPQHLGIETLLELVTDSPQTRDSSAISHDHVQAHSFVIKDLISILHTFPWLWENARASLEQDQYLQQWSAANNQDGTQDYEQIVDETNEDNLQDGIGDGDVLEAPTPEQYKDMEAPAEDVQKPSTDSIKAQMDQLFDRHRRLQVELRELEKNGIIGDEVETIVEDKWAMKRVFTKGLGSPTKGSPTKAS